MPEPAKCERAIFEAALELSSAAERRAYLKGACGDDAELRERVEALLRAHEEAGGFLPEDDPYLAAAGGGRVRTTSGLLPVTEKPGDYIGRYKLREKVGEGGCGVVYVAEQEEPVRRRVALKIIKLGMDTRSVVARFEAERQALAMMDHPNIAKVLDAGTTDTGRPYFVMELVRGIKITEYCDQHKVSTHERLELFIKVCQAVQHAHQKGIIHRDLKPSNILVTLHDGVPVPKVIDFGIAKATEGRLTEATVYTQLHQFIGTPAYMSPEQAEMSGLDIDTRSDIYSLGVLLYELLTGVTPFDAQTLVQSGLDEMRRIIREDEPKRPSTRLSTLEMTDATALTKHRQEKLPALVNLVRGDLDWIVMKCLEKDRTRRYETANGLAADLKRHLNHEPVVARPPSTAYWFQKAFRRNKLAFAAASAIGAALVVGLAIALAALAKERAANARAERQTRLAEQRMVVAMQRVESFLTNDLPAVWRLVGSTKATESMLRNTLSFMSALAPNAGDNPEFLLASARVQANLATLQGSRWGVSLGDPEAALASASNAWALLRSIPTGALPRVRVQEMTFRVERATGIALEALGREDEALAHYERMLTLATELDQQLPGTGNRRWTSEAHGYLAGYFMIKKKWEQMREHNDHLHRDLLTNTVSEDLGRLRSTGGALWSRAVYYNSSVSNRNVALALDYFRQSLSFYEAYLKRSNSDQSVEYSAVLCLVNIGLVLCQERNYAEGLPIVEEAVRRMESLADRDKANWIFQDLLISFLLDHARTLATATKAGVFSSVECLRLLEQARTSYQHYLERMNASAANPSRQKSWVEGPRRLRTLDTMHELGEAYQDAGMPNRAVPLFEDLFKMQRGLDNLNALHTMDDITRAYQATGRPDSAEAFYREQLAQHGSGLASLGLGRLLLERAKSDTENPDRAQEGAGEGERLLGEYLATVRSRYTNAPVKLERSIQPVAELRYRLGNYAAAEPLYREILQSRRARFEAESETVLDGTASLARLLADWAWTERGAKSEIRDAKSQIVERAREAERLLRECLAIRLDSTNSTHWRTGDVKSRLGGALVSLAVTDPVLDAQARIAKLAEAETLLLQGNERLQRSRSAQRKFKRDALERLVRLYQAWDKPEKLSEWQQKFEAFKASETKSSESAEEDSP